MAAQAKKMHRSYAMYHVTFYAAGANVHRDPGDGRHVLSGLDISHGVPHFFLPKQLIDSMRHASIERPYHGNADQSNRILLWNDITLSSSDEGDVHDTIYDDRRM